MRDFYWKIIEERMLLKTHQRSEPIEPRSLDGYPLVERLRDDCREDVGESSVRVHLLVLDDDALHGI